MNALKFRTYLRLISLPLLLTVGFSVNQPVHAQLPAGAPGVCKASLRANSSSTLNLRKVSGAQNWGPRVLIPSRGAVRNIGSISNLVMLQFNVENLLEYQGKAARNPETGKFMYDPDSGDLLKVAPRIAKPPEKIKGVCDTIARADADIAVLEEVESLADLEYLNERYLGGKYIAILIPGNDPRGINVGFLVKTDLPFDLEFQSYKNVAGSHPSEPLFSRDLPVMSVREAGSHPDSVPLMTVIGTHFKSQRPMPGDPLSEKVRAQQVLGAVEIIRYYQDLYSQENPLFMLGDYNRDVPTGPEFRPLWDKAKMKDAFDIAPADRSVPLNQRITEVYFPPEGGSNPSQLDSISGSPIVQIENLITEATIMPYLDEHGRPIPVSRTHAEKEKNPSDHSPVRVVVAFQKILRLFQARAAR